MRTEQLAEGVTLYLGDCRDVLPTLSAVDLVVTSPPYDNLRSYGEGFAGIDCLPVITAVRDALADGGVLMWNVADATINGSETGTSFRQALHGIECGLRLHDTMVYIKDNVSFPEEVRYFPGFEYMFVFSKGAPKTFNPIMDRVNKWAGTVMHGTDRQVDGSLKQISGAGKEIKPFGMRFNWWRLTNNSGRTEHPAPMPYAMADGHITSWSNEGDLVADPFLGSGTTGIAAVRLGRRFVGIELDPTYFDLACRRIEAAVREPSLFIAPPAVAKQLTMLDAEA